MPGDARADHAVRVSAPAHDEGVPPAVPAALHPPGRCGSGGLASGQEDHPAALDAEAGDVWAADRDRRAGVPVRKTLRAIEGDQAFRRSGVQGGTWSLTAESAEVR